MIEHPNVIPIAVAVAVCIFLAKEVLEFIRRYRLNARKLHAIRRFLAMECERNSFAIKKINDQVRAADEAHRMGWPVTIDKKPDGLPVFTVRFQGEGFSQSVVRLVHVEAVQKFLFEVASLDGRLFKIMEETLDALGEAKHVRDSLVEYVVDDQDHLGGFAGYAIPELDSALDAVRKLYLKCTGEPLAKGRVR